MVLRPFRVGIIPLREIIGNYNRKCRLVKQLLIIPLREIIGNYNERHKKTNKAFIIPLREIIGNYNYISFWFFDSCNYTLERDNRELQLHLLRRYSTRHYTLERDNRELQRKQAYGLYPFHYTLERDNRELQPSLVLTCLNLTLYP